MSRVVGWKVAASKKAASDQLAIEPAFEFSPVEEAVFARASQEYASLVESSGAELCATEELFSKIVRAICARHSNAGLTAGQEKKIALAAFHSFKGYGCLDFLLYRPDLEEITFVGQDKPLYVFSSKKKAWLSTNCFLCSERFAIAAINRMAYKSGKRLSFATPRLDSQLENGGRLHASCPPISPAGASFSIRLFPAKRMNMSDLVRLKAITKDAAAFLWFAMQSDCSMVIAGNTGGGKTTILNALCDLVGMRERLVLVEDTPELMPMQKHVARLVASKTPVSELVKDTLRMRPDRVFVGEVRSAPDCKALFDCLLSGQARGTYSTFHSDSADECLGRMRLMGATDHDLGSLDLIVVARRIPVYDVQSRNGIEVRRVTEICEVCPQGSTFVAKPIFSYDAKADGLAFSGWDGRLRQKIFSCLSNINEADFAMEWQKRAAFLEKKCEGQMAMRAEEYLFA
ncbi:MAG: ATPase, T2SS/T4P/T4SS family [Candidatus Micrarchaeia archaeon]